MPISSYAIRCREEQRQSVINQLHRLAGVTVGPETPRGIPVVVTSATTREARESGERLEAIPGVQSAVLVYHNFEDEL